MNDILRRIRAVRRTMRVRDRTTIVGSISYTCEYCAMGMRVQLAKGVASPDRIAPEVYGLIPAPAKFPCTLCEGQMCFDPGSHDEHAAGLSIARPYFRIPSRKAALELASNDAFHAQLVMPDES